MNYIPFDTSMLGQHEIIIWCPEEELWEQMKEELDAANCRWEGTGEIFSEEQKKYARHRAFRVKTNLRVTRGTKTFYEQEEQYKRWLFTTYEGRSIVIDVEDLI